MTDEGEVFIDGRIIYQRFSPLEQHGCAAGGATHVVASILAGAEVATDSYPAPNVDDFKRAVEHRAKQRMNISLMIIYIRHKEASERLNFNSPRQTSVQSGGLKSNIFDKLRAEEHALMPRRENGPMKWNRSIRLEGTRFQICADFG